MAVRVVEVLVQPGQHVQARAPLVCVARPMLLSLARQDTTAQACQVRPGTSEQLHGCDLNGSVRDVAPAMQGTKQAKIGPVTLASSSHCVLAIQAASTILCLPAPGNGLHQLLAIGL